MKITKMFSTPLSIPLNHPFGNRDQQANERVYPVIVKLTADNGLIVEYMPWWDQIYPNPPVVKNGYLEIPHAPGLGLELDNEATKKYAYE